MPYPYQEEYPNARCFVCNKKEEDMIAIPGFWLNDPMYICMEDVKYVHDKILEQMGSIV